MISEVDVDQLEAALTNGSPLIDVRMPDEFDHAHVPGAKLIPLPTIPEKLGEIPDAPVVYLICQSGSRSMKACEFLAGQGFTVANVIGGTLAWANSGRATESASSPI